MPLCLGHPLGVFNTAVSSQADMRLEPAIVLKRTRARTRMHVDAGSGEGIETRRRMTHQPRHLQLLQTARARLGPAQWRMGRK